MIFRKPRPTGNDNLPVERSPTIIARDTSLEGVIESDGDVEIQGHFRGTVHARSCHVGDSGFVEGTIVADDVGVRGRVMGPIRSVQVHLMRGAQVNGDVHNTSLIIDDGAQLNGAVWQSDDPLGTGKDNRALTEPPGASLFGDTLWPDRGQDNYRPLTAVKPRR